MVARWLFRGWMPVVAAALAGNLSGCAAQPTIQYVPAKVEVPVIEKPPPATIPPVPTLAIQRLTPASTDAEMMAAWVASVEQLKADDQRLRALLTPYTLESQAPGAP
jgi:hypothetical protein